VVLIVIGLIWVPVNHRWRLQGLLLATLVVLGTLPQVLNNKDMWIFLRLGLVYPILIIFVALGFYFIWKYLRPRWLVQTLLVGVYSCSVFYFVYHYIFVAPVHATTDKYFVERILASYIKRLPIDQKVVVLADESRFVFEELVFYNKEIVPANLTSINQAFSTNQFEVNNLRVDTECYDPAVLGDTLIIKDPSVALCSEDKGQVAGASTDPESLTDSPPAVIRSPYSGENRFYIVNDMLCGKIAGETNRPLDWETIQVETISNEAFCQSFIVKEAQRK
jgi:hypothetical protein